MVKKSRSRTSRYDVTRERIIDTTAQLFARNGYAATGVAELGEAVDLARGALYYYIQSKDALLSAIHDRVMDPLLTEAGAIRNLPVSASARLALMSELLIRLIIERRDHVWVFLHEYRHLTGDEKVKFRRKRAEFEKYISDLISAGVDEGVFDVADLRLATLSWLNLHNHTYHWVSAESEVSVERLSAGYTTLLLKGFARSDFTLDSIAAEIEQGRSELKVALADSDDTDSRS